MTVPYRIGLVAGGTGGHVFPALACARCFLQRGAQVVFFTDGRAARYLDKDATMPIRQVIAARYTKVWLLPMMAVSFAVSCVQVGVLLLRYRVRHLVTFGGYVSLPFLLVGWLLRCRLIAHEQNAVLGRVNRWMLPYIDKLGLGFVPVRGVASKHKKKTVHTGTPVRPSIVRGVKRQNTKRQSGALHILVLGGSQGASVFAEMVPQAIAQLTSPMREKVRLVQQCRAGQEEELKARYGQLGVLAEVRAFFKDIDARLMWSDVVICRAGASMISELLVVGRPAIFVPYPHAMNDHQRINAAAVVAEGFGWSINEGEHAALAIRDILAGLSPAVVQAHKRAAKKLARTDADARVVNLVMEAQS
ncbi:MAG: UDP-N-acetylglucosamine--N-acetylmuramyl-(pentapeptide) pyrophosphoryl-undecaprenol N-acetylglucosamine transferase [Alphaproteobacteria bacterium GM202ARS2]|nr:UDP-N-acetylglucosamine--N-acetylmuramyl-(pentapeptide) pyrophosphoryl-undecaprenol N-acetylglucosamine transferase [Alphaproteobacteria bacterium GM202ARS2]